MATPQFGDGFGRACQFSSGRRMGAVFVLPPSEGPPKGICKDISSTNSGLRQAIVYSGLSSNDGKLTGGSKLQTM